MIWLTRILKTIKKCIFSKSFWLKLGGFTVVCLGILIYMLNLASLHANELFHKYMKQQQVLKGNITAEYVGAHLNGHVMIENLRWTTEDNVLIMSVPRAELWVNPLAFVFKTVNKSSLLNVDLYDAFLVLGFNEKMQLDAIRQSKAPQISKGVNPDLENRKKNISWFSQKFPDTILRLHNFDLLVIHQQRHYAMHEVYLDANMVNDRYLHIDLHSHKFGGVLDGGICNINGVIDLAPEKREMAMNMSLYHIRPSSLGLQNLDDYTDIGASIVGKVDEPYIQGGISFKELNIGDLKFSKVYGNFEYMNGFVQLQDVTADFCGGDVVASGLYNIDSRDYSIDAVGKGIDVGRALKFRPIHAKADVDFHMTVDAPRKKNEKQKSHIWGKLETGTLYYKFYEVNSVKADADINGANMLFKNIVIEGEAGTLLLDRLELEKGNVDFGKLEYNDGVNTKEIPIAKFIKKRQKKDRSA